jgi:hypothetical protein
MAKSVRLTDIVKKGQTPFLGIVSWREPNDGRLVNCLIQSQNVINGVTTSNIDWKEIDVYYAIHWRKVFLLGGLNPGTADQEKKDIKDFFEKEFVDPLGEIQIEIYDLMAALDLGQVSWPALQTLVQQATQKKVK